MEVQQKQGYSLEIFVIDNGSTDGTVSVINSYKDKYNDIIKPIFLKTNTGTTYSRNLALKQASGEYIVLIDSDVELHAETIGKLLKVIRMNLKIGMVVPRLIYGNGELQKSTDNFPTLFTKVIRYFFLKRIEEKEKKQHRWNIARKVDYAISAFWLLRRQIIEDVGLLDEKIFYAPEDVDYCLRIWKKGYEILYVTDACATHYAQEISRGIRINKATIEHIKGLLFYFKKHNYIFRKPTFP